jgi:hypothetical protein
MVRPAGKILQAQRLRVVADDLKSGDICEYWSEECVQYRVTFDGEDAAIYPEHGARQCASLGPILTTLSPAHGSASFRDLKTIFLSIRKFCPNFSQCFSQRLESRSGLFEREGFECGIYCHRIGCRLLRSRRKDCGWCVLWKCHQEFEAQSQFAVNFLCEATFFIIEQLLDMGNLNCSLRQFSIMPKQTSPSPSLSKP